MRRSARTRSVSSPGAAGEFVRYPDKSNTRPQQLPLLLGMGIMNLAYLLLMPTWGNPWWLDVLGVALFVLLDVRLAMTWRHVRKSLRIDSSSISFPIINTHRRSSTAVIPISDIAGVGLLFRSGNAVFGYRGWYLTIWRAERSSQQLDQSCWLPTSFVVESGGTTSLTSNSKSFDPVTGTNRTELQRTQAAAVAKEIYARVYAAQGPNGPLATLALKRHPVVGQSPGAPVRAWWSPADGAIGYPAP